MNPGQQPILSLGAGGVLIIVGAGADATKLWLEYLLGIGIVLDPLLISPTAAFIFWLVLQHQNIPMFSGRNGTSAWVNLAIAETPVLDAIPDWTGYAIYITFAPRLGRMLRSRPR